MKYVCELCGMIYDEQVGDVRNGIPAGTAFENLPEYYECAGCGSGKEAFNKLGEQAGKVARSADDRDFWQGAKYSEGYHESER